jgi:hypothetical protein
MPVGFAPSLPMQLMSMAPVGFYVQSGNESGGPVEGPRQRFLSITSDEGEDEDASPSRRRGGESGDDDEPKAPEHAADGADKLRRAAAAAAASAAQALAPGPGQAAAPAAL